MTIEQSLARLERAVEHAELRLVLTHTSDPCYVEAEDHLRALAIACGATRATIAIMQNTSVRAWRS